MIRYPAAPQALALLLGAQPSSLALALSPARRLRDALRDVRDGAGSASAHALPSHCHKVGPGCLHAWIHQPTLH